MIKISGWICEQALQTILGKNFQCLLCRHVLSENRIEIRQMIVIQIVCRIRIIDGGKNVCLICFCHKFKFKNIDFRQPRSDFKKKGALT